MEPDKQEYLRQCVHIDPLAVQDEYVRIPSDLAYWNGVYADAQRELQIAKVELDILERELYAVIRGELAITASRVTEKMIESGMAQSGVWLDAKRRVANADAAKAKAYGTVDAVRTKKEMLISLGAHIRIEKQGDLVLREHSKSY